MKLQTSKFSVFSAFSAGLIFGVVFAPAVQAEEQGSLARGGKLYDKWYAVIKADKPTKSHPAYPADKKYAKKPASNWRCKECHGWDYMGKDGAYASGKHHTGIKGINGMKGADVTKIVAVLMDETHALSGKMDDEDFQDLALFVSKGQVDLNKYIDRAAKAPKGGDGAKGAGYFNTMCAQCHGKDGTLPKDMKKTLGKQMGNPWEVMHKIQNGQPAEQMPALRALDPQVTVDILAHLATLPKER